MPILCCPLDNLFFTNREFIQIMNEKAINEPRSGGSADEFFRTERHGGRKNEAQVQLGANRWHNIIASNLAIGVGTRLHGHKCEIYVSGMQVKLKNDFVCLPDMVVISGEPSFTDQNMTILRNPTLVADIFSHSTATPEKSRKLENFLESDSIKECLFIKESEMRIEHYFRQNAKQWIYRIYNERDDVISLESINCKISVAEIYSQVKLRQPEFSSRAVN